MTLWPHNLRLEVAAFSSSFTFSVLHPYGSTPADDFMLQRVLNCDGMNKLS
jgi:hypothetical protein